jgi:hypothetical protein
VTLCFDNGITVTFPVGDAGFALNFPERMDG